MRDEAARKTIISRLREDLIGPGSPDEVLEDLPSDRYLTGILFPVRTPVGADQGDEADTAETDAGDTGGGSENISTASAYRPSSAGLSFAIQPDPEGIAGAVITIETARYKRLSKETADQSVIQQKDRWIRHAMRAEIEELLLPADYDPILLDGDGIPGMKLHLRVKEWNGKLLVTAAISNAAELQIKTSRVKAEEDTFFQVSLKASASQGARIVNKPVISFSDTQDDDTQSAALIYRNTREYAVGHTCSADWLLDDDEVLEVRTQWIPEAVVKKSKETGDEIFDGLTSLEGYSPLSTKWLSEACDKDLLAGLAEIPALYNKWISRQEVVSATLSPEYSHRAAKHLETCRHACNRIRSGIERLGTDDTARKAFQLANRAIWLQNSWKARQDSGSAKDLVWRPFQLAFVLLTLSSAYDEKDAERDTMDLLWFPTGGGKTEAYLLLTAFIIFKRRLCANGGTQGAGVTVFMRYTLRLLTIQQFQRASALICACELLRNGLASPGAAAVPKHFGTDKPISIGLWVGDTAVPNKVSDAVESLKQRATSSPAQLAKCPSCGSELHWAPSGDEKSIEVHCRNGECAFGSHPDPLPVWTVDEDVYRVLPSLIIGTADKYAQLPRNSSTARLFGLGAGVLPPELIIQDELHLISGPLGTLAGIYEIAVDELCKHNGIRPKIIGSTATIRRADEQILALFDRHAFQFPPPGIDHNNSGFATLDDDDPGRLYVGITTAGRSAKFALQAVTASLLQSAKSPDIEENLRDAYWTLVTYFNSLRELGGALVLMRDDVERSIEEYANRRSEQKREIQSILELTSRVSSSEIPDMLEQLDKNYGDADCVDSVLASNMISVGVDVSRLGLMVVNGQPKSIAEYIQATSRVGRSRIPGLVVTVYNANKARDRSRYETFSNWHQSLYRDVEATSVTPFAPRARDKALHAAFVAVVRHLVPGMQSEPVDAAPYEDEIRKNIDIFVARAKNIDADEANSVRTVLHQFTDDWIARGSLKKYWDDWGDSGLLMSAETALERAISKRSKNAGKATPNSLRSVEASTEFVLVDYNYQEIGQ